MLRRVIDEAKSVPFADCKGTFHSVAMDFHHLGDKEWAIAEMVGRNVSVTRLLAEIAKCEIICSNCHRVRTWITDIAD